MNLKDILDGLLEDLLNNVEISRIMLKTQAFASLIDSDELKTWVLNEQRGYNENDTIPNYRQSNCCVKANFIIGNWRRTDYLIAVDAIDDDGVRNYLSTISFAEPISELESYVANKEKQTLMYSIPLYYVQHIEALYDSNNGNPHIEQAWKEVDIDVIKGIINQVKSNLLSLLLELNQVIGADLNSLTNEKVRPYIYQFINKSIVNEGEGYLSVNNGSVVLGDNNQLDLSPNLRENIESVIQQITALKGQLEDDEADIAAYIHELQKEVNSKISYPTRIKTLLRALKSCAKIAQEKVIEMGIDKIIEMLPPIG